MNSHNTPRKSNSSRVANLPLYSNSKFLSATSHSPKQNFLDTSANKSNSKTSHMDPNFSMQDNISEHNINSTDRTKKKEANFKHILNVHHISDIIAGKRTRRPPDQVIKPNGNPQQNFPDNSRSKSAMIARKRGRPSTNRKPITLHKAYKRQTHGTRKLQTSHSNFSQPQIGTRRSQRRMPTTPSILEKKAIPAKKFIKELPIELSNTTNDDSKKDAQEPEEEELEEESDEEENISEGSEESEIYQTKRIVNEYAITTRPKRSPQGHVVYGKNDREKRKGSDEKGESTGPQTLLTKIVNKDFSVENYLKFDERIRALNAEYTRPATYVNCDLRYFNFDFLVDKLGFFDVIIMDPPWRIKGAQQNDSSFMFSNSKFNLEYDTLSNQEIMNLKVERLSRKGFLFLWILSNQINTAYEMMNKWGYEVVDQMVWVKLKDKKIYLSHGYYFMHSFEMCLIGYKCPPGEQIEYNTKICNDVLFGEVRAKSQKPEELYEIADMLMPGSKKIELFARNHNLRPGWFSLGNQLGETYEKWYNIVNCDNCNQPIYIGIKRYKARHEPDYDLCEKCFGDLNKNLDDFFQMNNLVNEDVLHKYHSCNHCMTEPIWGIRFACIDCENFDLCECCFDKNLRLENKFHDIYHNFRAVEIPILANGLPAHYEKKCAYCFQKPILGVCFSCAQCPNLNFCQNCFFSKPHDEMKKFRGHKSHHNFNILAEPVDIETRLTKCSWCEICPIQGTSYKCENCYSFYFCEKCYQKRDGFKPNTSTTHKFYHTFTTIDGIDSIEMDISL